MERGNVSIRFIPHLPTFCSGTLWAILARLAGRRLETPAIVPCAAAKAGKTTDACFGIMRTVMKTRVLAIVGAASLLMACHTSELTRGKAKNLLNKVGAGVSTNQITFSPEQLQKLSQLKDAKDADAALTKLFIMNTMKPCLPDASDVRIVTGQFVQCQNPGPEITWQHPGVMASLKTPVKWVVIEVTGIADGQAPSEKIVEDTWHYDFSSFSLPKDVEAGLEPLRTGKALFRLYDDGWRFVQFM